MSPKNNKIRAKMLMENTINLYLKTQKNINEALNKWRNNLCVRIQYPHIIILPKFKKILSISWNLISRS